MRIYIKTLVGKIISLDVEPTLTIKQIKEMIEEKEALPPDHQRPIYKGIDLDNNKTLSNYKIENESTIHLILKPKAC